MALTWELNWDRWVRKQNIIRRTLDESVRKLGQPILICDCGQHNTYDTIYCSKCGSQLTK